MPAPSGPRRPAAPSPSSSEASRSEASRAIARDVLRIESEAIGRLAERLDASFDRALDLILAGHGRVVVSGIGKSGIVGRKIAATLASTGTPAHFLHPADAVHGDLGVIVAGDVVLALSNSGETAEMIRLLELVKRLGTPVIAFVGKTDSTLGSAADVAIDVGIDREACPLGLAPTASTTAALAMGDALALALSDRRGFTADDFRKRHPGGTLGKTLRRVADLMQSGDAVPRVALDAPMTEVIAEMTRKGRGMTTVVDAGGRLAGVITDGDLRRLMQKGRDLSGLRAADCRSALPKTIRAGEPASAALALLEKHEITAVVVVDEDDRVEGLVHVHNLWRLELF